MMSPYKETRHDYLHYIDWTSKIGRPINSPNTLTVLDYNKIKSSKYLMARKFDTMIDGKIIKMILNSMDT